MSDPEHPLALEGLAAAWLEAEDETTRNPAVVEQATRLGLAYEAALAAASLEEKRIAWEAARAVQGTKEMGSREWAAARRVSELLRIEYTSARDLVAGGEAGDVDGGSGS